MTSPLPKNALPRERASQEFDLERVKQLVSDLEQDLAKAPAGTPHLQELKSELEEFKQTLAAGNPDQGKVRERMHGIQTTLHTMTATIEGEVLLDSRYIVEAGRILGLV